MSCKHLTSKGKWSWCGKFSAYTNGDHCANCQQNGEEWIQAFFKKRDTDKTTPLPLPRKVASGGAGSKILRAGSAAIGRAFGKVRVSEELLAYRQAACKSCELYRVDKTGSWCGKPITQGIRITKESKLKKGCGCMLLEKWKYENYHCPRRKW